MQKIEINDDYVLVTRQELSNAAKNLILNVVTNANGEEVIVFDYYVKANNNKSYLSHFVNKYSLVEGYTNPPCLVMLKRLFKDGLGMHQLLLLAVKQGAKVKHVQSTVGMVDLDDMAVDGAEHYKLCKRYAWDFFDGEKILERDGNKHKLKTRRMPEGRVAVFIITSTEEYLKRCLDSLSFNTYRENTDIYVRWYGDNNCPQEVRKMVISKKIKSGMYRVNETGFNFSSLNNEMFNEWAINLDDGGFHYDYVLLMNDDVEIINPNFLVEMVTLSQRENADVVGAALFYPEENYHKRVYQHGGIFLGDDVHQFVHYGKGRNAESFYVPTREVSAVTFALALIKTESYDLFGGLGEKFYGDCNDVDFCYRVRKAGGRIWYSGAAEAWHMESATRDGDPTMQKDFASREYYRENKKELQKVFTL